MATRYVYDPLLGDNLPSRAETHWYNPPVRMLHKDLKTEFLMYRNEINPAACYSHKRDLLHKWYNITTPKIEHGVREVALNTHIEEIYSKVFGLTRFSTTLSWKIDGARISTKPKRPDFIYLSQKRNILNIVEAKLLINPHNSSSIEHVLSAYAQLLIMRDCLYSNPQWEELSLLGVDIRLTLLLYINPDHNMGPGTIKEWNRIYNDPDIRIILRNVYFPMEQIPL